MRVRTFALATAAAFLLTSAARGQSVRDHTRLTPNRDTGVTEAQATELTLTLTEVTVRPIQVWIRTAGVIDRTGRSVSATLSPADGARVRVGQRVRAFPPEARSSMYQARTTQVTSDGDRVVVRATLSGPGREGSLRYVMEIVTEHGDLLSVPNEAIIETGGESGGRRVVYVQQAQGRFQAREVTIGVQGELYTEIIDGVQSGDQVVTLGSFFIDAEHKLKGF